MLKRKATDGGNKRSRQNRGADCQGRRGKRSPGRGTSKGGGGPRGERGEPVKGDCPRGQKGIYDTGGPQLRRKENLRGQRARKNLKRGRFIKNCERGGRIGRKDTSIVGKEIHRLREEKRGEKGLGKKRYSGGGKGLLGEKGS